MHGLLGLAGLLALVALAFGQDASVWLARIIVVAGALGALWLFLLIAFERL